MQDLPDDPDSLKALVRQLWEENERLKAELAELCRRLGMDSTNSHKPPSSDGYKKKTTAPGLPKGKGRRNGGQAGHTGKTLTPVERPDRMEVHLPGQCKRCGRSFSADDAYEVIQRRQVFDLPEPRLEVTEHRLGQIECCGGMHCGTFPAEVTASVQYGPGVRALTTLLSVDHKLPLEQISQLFEDLYGYDLNSSTVLDTLRRGAEQAVPLEEAARARLLGAEVAHFDETGIRVAGKLHWLHTASTDQDTHLFVHEKRGQEALDSDASVLKDFSGTAVHDCWKPYFHYPDARHVLCGAHLLRELAGLKEQGRLWAEEMHEFLLDLHGMPRPIPAADAVRTHYRIILEQADREEPPPQQGKRGRPKQSPGRNLLDRLRTHQKGVLAFALESGIPFTNNQAERDLRGTKVKLKVSGSFRTLGGARVYARLQAVISTVRKQGGNVFARLRELFSAPPVLSVEQG
jgi:transposase